MVHFGVGRIAIYRFYLLASGSGDKAGAIAGHGLVIASLFAGNGVAFSTLDLFQEEYMSE